MPKIGFVTYRQAPRITADDSKMYSPLAQLGMKLVGGAWDDFTVRWQDFDVVVLRSTWDYHLRVAEFHDWLSLIDSQNIPLWNPTALVRWNLEKTYLRQLDTKGIPIVPTVFLEQGTTADLYTIVQERGWQRVVIKPTIGASAHKFWRTTASQAALQNTRLNKMLEQNSLMIQPLVEAITTQGEWSLIFFRQWSGDVEFSHAVVKQPKAGDVRSQSEYGGIEIPLQPSDALLAQAYRVVQAIPDEWMYARVDGVMVGAEFQLMELELIEPHLFLASGPDAPARFASAIRSVLG